jgi:hypothetical protein
MTFSDLHRQGAFTIKTKFHENLETTHPSAFAQKVNQAVRMETVKRKVTEPLAVASGIRAQLDEYAK